MSMRLELVRQALAEFLARRAREEREQRERVAISRHRALLARQAKALLAEQARPSPGEIDRTRERLPERGA